MRTDMTAQELVAIARRGRPDVRYCANRQGNFVAAWSPSAQRWVAVAGRLLDGRWVDCPAELWIDGKPANDPADWLGDEVIPPLVCVPT